MSRQITVQVWTEDEARDCIYAMITETINSLTFVLPAVGLEDVAFEVSNIFEETIGEVFYHVQTQPLEELTGALAEAALAEKVLGDIVAEIAEAFAELYPQPETPTLQSL